jgi:hypothetical protein
MRPLRRNPKQQALLCGRYDEGKGCDPNAMKPRNLAHNLLAWNQKELLT